MKSRRGPISLIVAGGLLALGPLWGLIGTVIGMIRTFNAMAGSGSGTPDRLSSDISTSLLVTWVGLIMSPIGLALLIGGIVWLVKIMKAEKTSNQASEAIAPQGGSQPQR